MQTENSVNVNYMYAGVIVVIILMYIFYTNTYMPQVQAANDIKIALDKKTNELLDATKKLEAAKSEVDKEMTQINSLTSINTDLTNKNKDLTSINKDLTNKIRDMNVKSDQLAVKTAELLSLRQKSCSLSNSEAASLGISNYSQESCVIKQNVDGLYNSLNMSSMVLLDSIVASDTSLSPMQKNKLLKVVNGLKKFIKYTDAAFNTNMVTAKNMISNVISKICRVRTIVPTLIKQAVDSAVKTFTDSFGYPRDKLMCSSTIIISNDPNQTVGILSSAGSVTDMFEMNPDYYTPGNGIVCNHVMSEGTNLYAMAKAAGVTVDADGYNIMIEGIREMITTLLNNCVETCNAESSTQNKEIDIMISDLTVFYNRLKNSIITSMVYSTIDRFKYAK